jgi:hypothetical protein
MTDKSQLSHLPDRDLFNPAMLALMSRVLDEAWAKAQPFFAGPAIDQSVVRASMAERIIQAIEAGVTDADGLKRAALSAMQEANDDDA